MTQKTILKKFKYYLQQVDPLKVDDPQLKYTGLQEGLCHGLSLSHAVMHYVGYENWWAQVLNTLTQWDGDPDNLDKLKKLKVSEGKYKFYYVSQLFEIAINHVIFLHHENSLFQFYHSAAHEASQNVSSVKTR